MRLTQHTITDLGILTLGLITAVIIIRSYHPPFPASIPSIPSETQRLIDGSTDPIVLFKGGKEFVQKGDLLAAAASFKKATQLDGKWRDAFIALGTVYIALDDNQIPVAQGDLSWLFRAESALNRAKKLDPLYQPIYEQLMVVYERTGQLDKQKEVKSTLKNLPVLN